MSARHSPGPWTVELYGGGTLVIHESRVDRVCFMATAGSQGDPEKIKANARLIAAAPDMLAALQWIAEIADKQYEQDGGLRADGARTLARLSDKARAAIAKAGGRS